MKITMVWKTVGSVLVIREGKEPPSDEEWDGLLVALGNLRKRGNNEIRAIVVTDGGGPNSPQRTRLKEAVQGANIRSAVVSDNIKIRFISSAVMLVSKNTGSFTMKELPNAYEHLKLNPEERVKVAEALRQMDEELDRGGPLRA